MLRKKIAAIALTSCLVVSIIPLNMVIAQEEQKSVTDTSLISTLEKSVVNKVSTISNATEASVSNAPSPSTIGTDANADNLEQIIKLVKSKISVPTSLSEFSYDYDSNSYDRNPTWSLQWSSKDNKRYINVTCDKEGNIIYYNYYGGRSKQAPVYLKSELKSKADNFINKIASNIVGKIKYVNSKSDIYSGSYTYNYERVENGIPMPDNSISVEVDYKTGEIKSYNASWLYNVEIPSKTTKITKEEAAEKIGKNVTMELSYQNAYTTEADGTTKVKAFLVYRPSNDYIAVDAKTGEVYTTQNQWIDNNKSKESYEMNSIAYAGNMDEIALTQEEINSLQEMKKLISKEQAIKAVKENKSLLIDENINAISAKLYKGSDYSIYDSSKSSTQYVWNITMNDTREVKENSSDTYRAYANARVDAVTGKILSFDASVKEYYNPVTDTWKSVTVKYSMKQGKKILESFLKEQIPDKFEKVAFTDNNNDYVVTYVDNKEVYGGYNYNYERVNEGISYKYNYISGSVDGVTGKIYNFEYNWDDNITFESPKGAMSPEKAFKAYIGNEGYHLVYEVNNIHNNTDTYSVTNEVRLVYRTDINPHYVSPFTGKILNSDGSVYDKTQDTYSYSDVNGLSSERNILILADLGIGFNGGTFKPNEFITVNELTELMEKAGFYISDDDSIVKNKNMITISRLDASKLALSLLGYNKVATIKGIYSVDFNDKETINQSDIGYVAIAWGLNLIKTDSNNKINANEKVTRENTADLIIGMLNTLDEN